LLDANFLHSGVVIEPLLDTEAVCLLPEPHPLTAKEIITPEDLDGVEYVAINRRYTMRAMLDQVFSSHRVSPRFVIETDAAMHITAGEAQAAPR
jgi:DNA-binding transcriptional LysR family regulator